MSRFIPTHPALRWIAYAVAGILLVALLLLGSQAVVTSAQTGQPETGSGAPVAPQAGPHTCTIANIAVLTTRIHVKCTTPVVLGAENIYYFAANADSANMLSTNRWLALMNTTYSLNKPLYIYYNPNSAANPPGCQPADCRGIEWIYIVP